MPYSIIDPRRPTMMHKTDCWLKAERKAAELAAEAPGSAVHIFKITPYATVTQADEHGASIQFHKETA